MTVRSLAASTLLPSSPINNLTVNSLTLSSPIIYNPYTGSSVVATISAASGSAPWTATITLTGTTPAWTSVVAQGITLQATDSGGSLGAGTVTVFSVVSSTVITVTSTAQITNGIITNIAIVSLNKTTITAPSSPSDPLQIGAVLSSSGLVLTSVSSYSAPGSNKLSLYTKSDGNIYYIAGATGIETPLTASIPGYGYGDEGLYFTTGNPGGNGASLAASNTWAAQQIFSAGLYSSGALVFTDYATPPSASGTGTTQLYSYNGGFWYRAANGTATQLLGGTGATTGSANTFTALQTLSAGAVFSNGTATAPSLTFANSTTTGEFSPAANILAWATNGTERMRIDASGSIGIGGLPSSGRLHLLGETLQFPVALFISPSGHANSRRAALQLDDWLILQDSTGTGPKDFSLYQVSSSTTRMNVTTTGYVGFGVTPTATLHVVGTGTVAGAIAPRAFIPALGFSTPSTSGAVPSDAGNGQYQLNFGASTNLAYVYLPIPTTYGGGNITARIYGSSSVFAVSVNTTSGAFATSTYGTAVNITGATALPTAVTLATSATAGNPMSIKISCTSGSLYGMLIVFGE